MNEFKIGYVNGLDTQSTYEDGKALYASTPFTLDNKQMCRAVGKIASVSSTHLTCVNIINYPNETDTDFQNAPNNFSTNEFQYGFIRMLSGSCKNKVYKISSNSTSILITGVDVQSEGVSSNDYFEVVTGSSMYTFRRNPLNQRFTKKIRGSMQRLPFYEGSIVIPTGYERDDITVLTYLTSEKDIDRFELMLNHVLDYVGFDSLYSTGISGENSYGSAPMILQDGNNIQYLFFLNDYKIVRDGKQGNIVWEIMIHGQNYL